jgi:lysophospholipase L1-like esterase
MEVNMSSAAPRVANMLLAIVSAILAVAIIEIGIHVLVMSGQFPAMLKQLGKSQPIFDKYSGSGLYYSHPYVSYDMRPGYQNDRVKINASGFRGDPLEIPKPADGVRIFALGESTTYGIFNAQDETWPHHLQKHLRSKYPGSNLEVVNAGLVSATTADNLARLLLRVIPLGPDILIIYHGYNDLAPRMFNGFDSDYYHFRRTPVTERHILSSFYVVRVLTNAILSDEVSLMNTNLLEHTWRMENLPALDGDKIYNFQRSNNSTFERNLDYMISAVIGRGVQVVLATFGFDGSKKNWNPLMPDQLWGAGIEQNNRAVRTLAAKHGVPLCLFAERAASDHSMFDDSIHLTSHGNAVLAECVAAALESRGELKGLLERRGAKYKAPEGEAERIRG